MLPPRVEPSASGAGGHCVLAGEVGAPGGRRRPRGAGGRAEGRSRPLPRARPHAWPRAALHVPSALEDEREGDAGPATARRGTPGPRYLHRPADPSCRSSRDPAAASKTAQVLEDTPSGGGGGTAPAEDDL